MRRNRINQWLDSVRHPSDEDLLAQLDGELSPRRSRQVRAHLESCWRCGARSEKMRFAISRFVDHWDFTANAALPPENWRRFETRLRQAAKEEEEARQKGSWLAAFKPPRLPRLVVVLGSVLAVLIWFNLRSPVTVSAAEAIRLAEEAELRSLQDTDDPVVYHKFQVHRRTGSAVDTSTVEVWNASDRTRLRQEGDGDVWEDLERVLEKCGMSGRRVLSASAYGAWYAGLTEKRDEVHRVRLPDGSEALEINTVALGPQGADAILEARMLLRKRDWHALEQRLRVQGESGVREFELTELAFNVTARSALDPWIFAEQLEAVPAPPAPAEPVAAFPSVVKEEPVASTVTEILALSALHRAGACLGEPVEIVTESDGEVVVRGLAETEERKQALLAALQQAPAARFEIQTVEEMLRAMPVSELPPEERHPAPAPQEVHGGKMPIQPLLGKRMQAPEITNLANLAVSNMRESMSHAWAIRRLAERFPKERLAKLDSPSRTLLAEMLRRHAAAARDASLRYRTIIEAVLPYRATSPPSVPDGLEWGGETQEILTIAQAAERLTFALFTGSSPLDETAGDAVERLVGFLSDLEGRARQLEGNAARLLQPGLDASQAAVRR